MLIRSIAEVIAAPSLGLLAVADNPVTNSWQQVGALGILAMLLWQVTQHVLNKRNGGGGTASVKDFMLAHEHHDRVLEAVEAKIDGLIASHNDPRSGFSTYFLDEKANTLIELSRDVLKLQRDQLDLLKEMRKRDS